MVDDIGTTECCLPLPALQVRPTGLGVKSRLVPGTAKSRTRDEFSEPRTCVGFLDGARDGTDTLRTVGRQLSSWNSGREMDGCEWLRDVDGEIRCPQRVRNI